MRPIPLPFFNTGLLAFFLAAAAPASAATLHRGLGPEPDSLDIHAAQGLSALQVLRDLHEGLLTYGPDGALQPGVAERWSLSEDGLELRFELRPTARWSDGEPVLAEDFVRGWQQALAPDSQSRNAEMLAPVRGADAILTRRADPSTLGIRALGPRSLLVRLEHPTPWFPENLAHPVSFPLPPAGGPPAQRPVNGPFLLAEATPRGHIALARNERYHAAETVKLEGVTWYPIEDPGSELARYRAGELHITETIPPGRYDWLRGELGSQLRVSPYLGSFWLGVNLRRGPLGRSADLRRALSLAIDRATLVRVVLGSGERPAWSAVPPGLGGYRIPRDPDEQLSPDARRAKAQRLFRRAGYGPEQSLRVELRFNTSAQHRRLAVAVAAMWKQVLGVSTELVQEEWKVFVNNRRQGVITELFRGGWIADYADPVSFLDLFRGDGQLNDTGYANGDYDRLLTLAAGEQGGARLELLQQAETLLQRDTPIIPLYYYVSRHLVHPAVRGFHDNVRDVHLSRYLSLEEAAGERP
jgi:oligopeptide transport system substrate-binding protein